MLSRYTHLLGTLILKRVTGFCLSYADHMETLDEYGGMKETIFVQVNSSKDIDFSATITWKNALEMTQGEKNHH